MVKQRSIDSFRTKYQNFFCVYAQRDGSWQTTVDGHHVRISRRKKLELKLSTVLSCNWALTIFVKSNINPVFRVYVSSQSDLIEIKKILHLTHRLEIGAGIASSTLAYDGIFNSSGFEEWASHPAQDHYSSNSATMYLQEEKML